MTTHLLTIQPKYRKELIENVRVFIKDCEQFYIDYKANGPTIDGLTPRESSDRQILFHSKVENLYKRYETFHGGEILFGVPVTEYPQLERIRRDLLLLQRLYILYNKVLDTVSNYFNIAWPDVNIEKINQELADFQKDCRRLPTGLRSFPAFHTLKKTIDDFSECKFIVFLFSFSSLCFRFRLSIVGNDVESSDANASLATHRRNNGRNRFGFRRR